MGAFTLRDAAGGSALRDNDTLRGAAAAGSATIAQATDTGSALALSARSTTPLGQASHTTTALAVTSGGPVQIAQASETDTALAATGSGGAAVGGLENSPLTGRYAYSYPLQVVVGDQDLTRHVQNASWSSVDPGGFEMCQISLANPVKAPRAGERITIRYGLEVAWQGRVNDPGNANSGRTRVEAISGVGYGAGLKDGTMREIYRDIDMGRWTPVAAQRRINIASASTTPTDASALTDPTTGAPALFTNFTGDWPATALPHCEASYDAAGIDLGSLYYAWKRNVNVGAGPDNFEWSVGLLTNELWTGANDTPGDLQAAGPGSNTQAAGGSGRKFAAVYFRWNTTAAGTQNFEYGIYWTTLAVYGNHGLTKRGTEPNVGFYPTDIAADALADYNALSDNEQIDLGPVDTDSNAYAVPHSTYLEETPHERIIDDMLRLQLGWHWGVWEPAGLHSDTPRLFLTKPPENATAHVARRELGDDFDAPRVRLDQLYDTAKVTYTDASGRASIVTVTVDNPLLAQAGVGSRTLTLNAGRSTSAAATTYGTFALNLAFAAARGAGSATLPSDVGTASGRKPACLLRAGRDRLRITDMPDPGPLHESDTRRYDSFHVRRVETSVGPDGVPKTRVELGSGADLMEVLNARTAAATVGLT